MHRRAVKETLPVGDRVEYDRCARCRSTALLRAVPIPATQPTPVACRSLRCLSVVMPVYNEVLTLLPILHQVQAVPLPKEIIIVDDGSVDGTRELLERLRTRSSVPPSDHGLPTSIKILFHDRNQGKGAAIRTGVAQASGDITIIQDADLEYDPADYGKLVEPIMSGDADVVYGSRFLGERHRVLYFWHALGNGLLTFLSNACTNVNLSDMETGYKAFRTDVIKRVRIRSNRFGFEPEITAKVARMGCRIYEVSISYKGRSYAEGKKITWKDGLSAIFTILKYWLIEDVYEEAVGLRTLQIMARCTKYNEWLLRKCRPFVGRRVLEIGAGTGNITRHLLDRELVVATDVEDFRLEELARKFAGFPNVNVQRLDLLDDEMVRRVSGDCNVDTVLAMNVLEYIDYDRAALRSMNRLLPRDGRLVLLVPAHQRLYSELDRRLGHDRRYDKASISAMLTEAGFHVEQLRYLNGFGALVWFVKGRMRRKKIIPSRQLRALDRLVWTLNIEKHVEPVIGLSVLAVARKVNSV